MRLTKINGQAPIACIERTIHCFPKICAGCACTNGKRESAMSSKRRAAIVVGMIAVALLSCSAPPVHAADKAPPGVAALPGTWTKESARDVLSRLSDEQVRTLLLDQLDK